jgi:hypothetical protein
MALTISQLLAASHDEVLSKIPVNQWSDQTAMQALEKGGFIKRINGSPAIEEPLDYQSNPDAEFLADDFQTVGMSKTEVLTAASYSPAVLSVPVKWSKADDGKNPEANQKVNIVKSLLENAAQSHDEMIEETLFAAAVTDNFNPLPVLIPTDGQGTIGGIGADVETWWRNQAGTYSSDFSDIEATLTTLWNAAGKGSGSKLVPTLLIGSADAHAGYEGTLTPLQRFSGQEFKSGARSIMFKTADFVFGQYVSSTGDAIYGLNPKAFKLVTFKNAYRQKGDVIEIPNVQGYVMKMFSMLQAVVSAKSRLFVAYHA